MGYRSVLYRKQLETRGAGSAPMPLEEGITKLKEMASIKADQTSTRLSVE